MEDKIQELRNRKEQIKLGGGREAIERLHQQGMLTARERLDQLFDAGTFVELDMMVKHRSSYFGMDKKEIPAEGVVIGYGKVEGRTVFAYSQDFTARAGSRIRCTTHVTALDLTAGRAQGDRICLGLGRIRILASLT